MIEWHKAKDELPSSGTPVLVACNCGGVYPENVMFVMKLAKDEYRCVVWECLYDFAQSPIYDDDQWAYINLPEKDGDSD